MVQSESGAQPTQGDLNSWASTYGSTHTVMNSSEGDVMSSFWPSGPAGFPSAKLMEPMMVVNIEGPFVSVSESDIEAAVPN